MSLCRWAADCHVYVYEEVDTNLLVCCACCLVGGRWAARTKRALRDHLQAHLDAGHVVPSVAEVEEWLADLVSDVDRGE